MMHCCARACDFELARGHCSITIAHGQCIAHTNGLSKRKRSRHPCPSLPSPAWPDVCFIKQSSHHMAHARFCPPPPQSGHDPSIQVAHQTTKNIGLLRHVCGACTKLPDPPLHLHGGNLQHFTPAPTCTSLGTRRLFCYIVSRRAH